jgi:hypothetical protein
VFLAAATMLFSQRLMAVWGLGIIRERRASGMRGLSSFLRTQRVSAGTLQAAQACLPGVVSVR